jgi:hypothetical protein
MLAACKSGAAERRTAGPSASPDFLLRVAASIKDMWFSLRRTTYLVVARMVKQEIRGSRGICGSTDPNRKHGNTIDPPSFSSTRLRLKQSATYIPSRPAGINSQICDAHTPDN